MSGSEPDRAMTACDLKSEGGCTHVRQYCVPIVYLMRRGTSCGARSHCLPTRRPEQGGVHVHGQKPYCKACWTSKFAERCGAFSQPFVGRERVVLFEGRKLHPA